jgi:hypothetical protein
MQNHSAKKSEVEMPIIFDMIRKMDLETYRNTVNSGADVALDAFVMYVGESLVPTDMLNL